MNLWQSCETNYENYTELVYSACIQHLVVYEFMWVNSQQQRMFVKLYNVYSDVHVSACVITDAFHNIALELLNNLTLKTCWLLKSDKPIRLWPLTARTCAPTLMLPFRCAAAPNASLAINTVGTTLPQPVSASATPMASPADLCTIT